MSTTAATFSVEDPWSAAPARAATSGSSSNSRPLTWAPGSSSHSGANGPYHAHLAQSSASLASDDVQADKLPSLFETVYELCRSAEQSEDLEISLGQLGKVVRCAPGLNASDVEEIINLSCSSTSSHCSKEEYATALVLIAQLQAGGSFDVQKAKDVLSSGGDVPVPQLDLGKLRSSTLASRSSTMTDLAAAGKRAAKMSNTSSTSSSLDPWAGNREGANVREGLPASSSIFRSSTLRAWNEEGTGDGRPSRPKSPLFSPVYTSPHPTSVHLLPELGGFLFFRHVLYLIKTPLCAGVKRRYSDFVSLHDYLLSRYPFRLIPPLPPKRLSLPHMNRTQPAGQQDAFLEQRRLALARYTRSIMSHPVMRKDAIVLSFFSSGAVTEVGGAGTDAHDNASSWKGIPTDEPVVEEGLDDSWTLSEADIMHVPVDTEDKLKKTKDLAGTVLDRWNAVVIVFERQVRRTEAMSAESTRLSLALSSLLETEEQTYQGADDMNDTDGPTGIMPRRSDAFRRSSTLMVSNSQDYADLSTARFHALQQTLDTLKNGRDLWVSLKDLFRRHDKLGRDPIPDLEARIESGRKRWKATQEEKKPGWQEQSMRIKQEIEKDQRLIERFRRRNQRVRVALWHEVARMQELKNHMLANWRAYAKNEAVHLAASKQAAEELAIALDQL